MSIIIKLSEMLLVSSEVIPTLDPGQIITKMRNRRMLTFHYGHLTAPLPTTTTMANHSITLWFESISLHTFKYFKLFSMVYTTMLNASTVIWLMHYLLFILSLPLTVIIWEYCTISTVSPEECTSSEQFTTISKQGYGSWSDYHGIFHLHHHEIYSYHKHSITKHSCQ